MDEFEAERYGKTEFHHNAPDATIYAEISSPRPAHELLEGPPLPIDRNGSLTTAPEGPLIPDTTEVSARLHTPAEGLTIYGQLSPQGFSGTVVAFVHQESGITHYTDLTYVNNCAIEGSNRTTTDATENSPSRSTPDQPLPVAEAVANYEQTAAALAANPEVQAIAERFSAYLEAHGMHPDDTAFTLASGKQTIQCLGF